MKVTESPLYFRKQSWGGGRGGPWAQSSPTTHSVTAARCLPVTNTLGAGVVSPDNDKNMLKVRADVFRAKWLCPRLLENYCHNVISNVPLPQELQENKQAPT